MERKDWIDQFKKGRTQRGLSNLSDTDADSAFDRYSAEHKPDTAVDAHERDNPSPNAGRRTGGSGGEDRSRATGTDKTAGENDRTGRGGASAQAGQRGRASGNE